MSQSGNEGKSYLDCLTPTERLQEIKREALRMAELIDQIANDPQKSDINRIKMEIVQLAQNADIRYSHLLGIGSGSFSIDDELSVATALSGSELRLVLDVGANEGIYTQGILRRSPNVEVHLFEPSPVNVDRLTSRFDHDIRVHVNDMAISDDVRQAVLYSDVPGSGLGSLCRRDLSHRGMTFSEATPVKTTTLDRYWVDHLSRRPIDLLKMDIEGEELKALQGARNCLSAVKVIQFEFGGSNIDARTYFKDFWDLLNTRGFEIYRQHMFGAHRINKYNEREERFMTCNFFARNSASIS